MCVFVFVCACERECECGCRAWPCKHRADSVNSPGKFYVHFTKLVMKKDNKTGRRET